MDSTLPPEFYRVLLEDSPQATVVFGADNRCRWTSPGFAKMVFQTETSYFGQPIEVLWDELHPDDRQTARDSWAALTAEEPGSSVPLMFRIRVKSGDWRLAEAHAINRLDHPDVQGLVLHLSLLVDRKKAEDLLLSERERLLVTLRSIGDGVIVTDAEGRITLMNSVTEDLTDWTQAEALGRRLPEVFRIVNEETGIACVNPIEKVFEQGVIVGLANHTALISKTGRVSVIEDSAAPIRDSAGRIIGAILVFRDVTQAKRTAAELLRMQKLESIGVLAGGIAHDFNNILTAILGNASLGTLMFEAGHPVQEILNGIQQATKRAGELTRQLLTFAKGGAPALQSTRIQDLVQDQTRFLLHGSSCEARFDFPEDLDPVMVDPGQLGQVIQNLVLNAVQAMKEHGLLEIRGLNVLLSGSSVPPLPDGRYLKLEFVDHGPGIEPEMLDKIFEPYFTTKATGSGLGLSVVWSIVKNHGGWIQVFSRWGEGTTFQVWLPSGLNLVETKETVPLQTVPVHYRGTALVMDDEADPRRTLVAMLRHLGYTCLEAAHGDDALSLADGLVSLAVLDLTIRGGKGGREILEELRQKVPGLRVIVTSGYSVDPVLADHRGFGFDAALRKPFTLADLTLALDQAFGDRP